MAECNQLTTLPFKGLTKHTAVMQQMSFLAVMLLAYSQFQ